ncbi:tetratricopeptide (TPR) repeat protein [Paenibacillus sp. 4624]|jgi:tetratricopeptide (TPR) repeat protein|uniref:Uncharacterized protein n=1 Tax=Paenibacillus amylolyticus TaxID=1451 RepID=A0A5M9X1A6_PAEAM|nr:hypothetical protein [Paenibacillus amylolyticus]KAA8787579.1 hypothetical protein EC604_27485 [Paenibacillus amylolyticus]
MDQQEYGRYLLAMGGEEFEPEEEEQVSEEHLYGFFQWFMPVGAGVERVFEPIPSGDRFLDRIRPIYEMLNPEDFTGEYVPGYFNGGQGTASEEMLRRLGEDLIKGLKSLFSIVPEDDEAAEIAKEALQDLACVKEVVVLPQGELGKLEQRAIQGTNEEDSDAVYEALGDLLRSRSDYDEAIEILSEAYYSIACDYWVAYYLQWPRYKGLQEAENCLYPYFELYRYGYNLHWTKTTLFIGKR